MTALTEQYHQLLEVYKRIVELSQPKSFQREEAELQVAWIQVYLRNAEEQGE